MRTKGEGVQKFENFMDIISRYIWKLPWPKSETIPTDRQLVNHGTAVHVIRDLSWEIRLRSRRATVSLPAATFDFPLLIVSFPRSSDRPQIAPKRGTATTTLFPESARDSRDSTPVERRRSRPGPQELLEGDGFFPRLGSPFWPILFVAMSPSHMRNSTTTCASTCTCIRPRYLLELPFPPSFGRLRGKEVQDRNLGSIYERFLIFFNTTKDQKSLIKLSKICFGIPRHTSSDLAGA